MVGALAALLVLTPLAATRPSLASQVPHMTAPVVNVRATGRSFASTVPFVGGFLHPRHKSAALGSGVIISRNGLVLTNEHIVHGAAEIKVSLGDGRDLPARVIGTDQDLDVAVLSVATRGELLPAARLGNSSRLRVGDSVVAIGNPYGLDHSVTSGIVSARGRMLGVGPKAPLIQTDASINPGNSGGPLYDLDGRVVALNTAMVEGARGIGFALPVNVIRRALPQLERDGHIRRGAVGVAIAPVPAPVARALGEHAVQQGALVAAVQPGGPGAAAGILPGDVIVRWDGEALDGSENLPWMIALTPPGTRVQVSLVRDGDVVATEVKLAAAQQP